MLGKTTLLKKWIGEDDETTHPTIGFNVEDFIFSNYRMTIWNGGGLDKIRPLWKHYFHDTYFLIFVVDVTDRKNIDEFH